MQLQLLQLRYPIDPWISCHATVLTRHAPSQGWRFQIELPWKMMSSSGTSGHMLSMFMYMLFIVILCLYLCLCYWVCHLRIGNDNSNEEINDNPSSLPVSQASIWNQAIFNLMHYVSTLGQETPTIVSLHCSNK